MLVLQEKNEDDSTRKYCTESEQYNAPPLLDGEIDLNKHFKTYTPVPEGVCLVSDSIFCIRV